MDKKGNAHSNGQLTIAVEEQVEFTCEADDIESNPDVSMFTFFMGEEERKTQDSHTWDPVFSFVNNTGNYTCTANNGIGEGEISNPTEVIVQGKNRLLKEICLAKVVLCYSALIWGKYTSVLFHMVPLYS